MRNLWIIAALPLVGCAASGHDSVSDADAFRAAAISWVGAPLDEMVKAWGQPNRQIIDAEPGRTGMVRWRAAEEQGGIQTGKIKNLCSVEARFDLNRTILRIDTISHDCDDRFADAIEALTRPIK